MEPFGSDRRLLRVAASVRGLHQFAQGKLGQCLGSDRLQRRQSSQIRGWSRGGRERHDSGNRRLCRAVRQRFRWLNAFWKQTRRRAFLRFYDVIGPKGRILVWHFCRSFPPTRFGAGGGNAHGLRCGKADRMDVCQWCGHIEPPGLGRKFIPYLAEWIPLGISSDRIVARLSHFQSGFQVVHFPSLRCSDLSGRRSRFGSSVGRAAAF